VYKGVYKEIPSLLEASIFKDIDLFSSPQPWSATYKKIKIKKSILKKN